MPHPSALKPADWRRLYSSGAVPQLKLPESSLIITAISLHTAGEWSGYMTLSLGSRVTSSGPDWQVSSPLCAVLVPDNGKYEIGMVLPRIPGNALPLSLCFPDVPAKFHDYRVMTVEQVNRKAGGGISLDFAGSSIGLDLSSMDVRRFGLGKVVSGNKLRVKGRKGNDDLALWGMNTIRDIRAF